ESRVRRSELPRVYPKPGSSGSMTNRERCSEMTSSVSVGRCAMSTVSPFGERPPYDAQKGAVGLSDSGCVVAAPAGRRLADAATTSGRSGPVGSVPAGGSDVATLGGTRAVVRLRGDVLDGADLEARRG